MGRQVLPLAYLTIDQYLLVLHVLGELAGYDPARGVRARDLRNAVVARDSAIMPNDLPEMCWFLTDNELIGLSDDEQIVNPTAWLVEWLQAPEDTQESALADRLAQTWFGQAALAAPPGGSLVDALALANGAVDEVPDDATRSALSVLVSWLDRLDIGPGGLVSSAGPDREPEAESIPLAQEQVAPESGSESPSLPPVYEQGEPKPELPVPLENTVGSGGAPAASTRRKARPGKAGAKSYEQMMAETGVSADTEAAATLPHKPLQLVQKLQSLAQPAEITERAAEQPSLPAADADGTAAHVHPAGPADTPPGIPPNQGIRASVARLKPVTPSRNTAQSGSVGPVETPPPHEMESGGKIDYAQQGKAARLGRLRPIGLGVQPPAGFEEDTPKPPTRARGGLSPSEVPAAGSASQRPSLLERRSNVRRHLPHLADQLPQARQNPLAGITGDGLVITLEKLVLSMLANADDEQIRRLGRQINALLRDGDTNDIHVRAKIQTLLDAAGLDVLVSGDDGPAGDSQEE